MRRRRSAVAGGVVAGVAAGALAGVRRVYRGSVPPHHGHLNLPGLAASVRIARDTNGTPHIRAATEADAIAALGFCHAQDRLFQMELIRRVIRGTLAELVGKEALDTDRYVRVLGLAGSADREADGATGDARAFLLAYCNGVNAWLASDAYRAPLELRLLMRRRPAVWEPGDVLLPHRFLTLALSQNWEGEIVRARIVERLGRDRLAELEPGYPVDGATALPSTAADAVAAALRAKQAAGGGPGAGSNNWVLSAERTTTGGPLVANDPHLLLGAPCAWYVADLAWEGGRVAGLTIPGTAAVVIGQTDEIAWGLTNTEADTQDLFAVDLATEPVERRREEIRVRGRRAAHVEEVVTTRHGPVVTPLVAGETRALALRWSALEPSRSIDAFRGLASARSGDEIVTALSGFGGPVLNCIWATRAGDIGYQMIGGPIPIRGAGIGLLPRNASDPDADWAGTVPYDQLPAWRNPDDGAIVTANNRIVGADYPHFISAEWLNPYRAARIAALLAVKDRHSADDCARIQTDVHSLPLVRLQAIAARHGAVDLVERRALGLLAGWDGEMDPDSAGAAIAATLLRHLTDEIFAEVGAEIDRFLGSSGFSRLSPNLEFFGRSVPTVLDLLDRADDAWFRDGRTWPGVFAKSLTRACIELERRLGADPDTWAWGDAHGLVLDHPLAALPGLDRVFRRGPFPLPGDADTVWAAWQPPDDPDSGVRTVGPGMRFIADLADPDNTRIVLCGGQSGHPASDAYADQVPDWLAGRTRLLHWSSEAIDADTVATLVLEP